MHNKMYLKFKFKRFKLLNEPNAVKTLLIFEIELVLIQY